MNKKIDLLYAHSNTIKRYGDYIKNKDETMHFCISPFIHTVLGFNIFNKDEVIQNFAISDHIIDYAIKIKEQIYILVQCKNYKEPLKMDDCNALKDGFKETGAQVGILTNGVIYQIYVTLDETRELNSTPLITIDLNNLDDDIIHKFQKIMQLANQTTNFISPIDEIRYTTQIKNLLTDNFASPSNNLVDFFITKFYANNEVNEEIKNNFSKIIHDAFEQFINEQYKLISKRKTLSILDQLTPAKKTADDEYGNHIGYIPKSKTKRNLEEIQQNLSKKGFFSTIQEIEKVGLKNWLKTK